MLRIHNLHVKVGDKAILDGVSLEIKPGEVHAIMGPNGSGKSTLANTLVGHPGYEVTDGNVQLDKQEVLELSPDQRAQAGLFLAFQYPIEIPGVRVNNFLKLAYEARFVDQPEKKFPSALAFRQHLDQLAEELKVKKELLKRGLNEGFSGGEKKRLEILQMAVLEPKYAILDETDSGLDVDAIKAVAEGVKKIIQKYNTGVVVVTHYQRILKYLQPDFVHVLVDGKITESGAAGLAEKIELTGYTKK
jgi:Fe-S cluster assembly ATP-binding protein